MNRYVILVQVLLKHGEMQLSAMPTTYVDERRMQRAECALRGRCNREKPPCKYFHPPQHLKDQLLINGRNHLALKNALLQQMPLQAMLPGQLPTAAVSQACVVHPDLGTLAGLCCSGVPGVPAWHVQAARDGVPLWAPARARGGGQRGGAVTVCMDFVKGRCSRDQCRYFHPPPHLQAQLKATQSRAGAAAAAAAAAMVGTAGCLCLWHHTLPPSFQGVAGMTSSG
ncbi:hypothetical protein HPB49_005049 [Dermacentor silvarum]|uniref:Uncharacterized protein n=1 Tax=Dermacentor silvarum TaxID=543639 RepID=A0ACB8DAZ8_DERSI|nr:hypothetical protein HPB49_005049 [Dermacentor silvarum]